MRLSERMRILWSGTKVPRRGTKVPRKEQKYSGEEQKYREIPRRGTKVPRRETKVPRNTEERNKKNGDNMESCMEELYRGGYDR